MLKLNFDGGVAGGWAFVACNWDADIVLAAGYVQTECQVPES